MMLFIAAIVNFSKLKCHHFPVAFEFFNVSMLLSGSSPHPSTWHLGHPQRPHPLPCLLPLFPLHCSLIPSILCSCHLCLGWPPHTHLTTPAYSWVSCSPLPATSPSPPQPESGPRLPWLPVLLSLLVGTTYLSVDNGTFILSASLRGLCTLKPGQCLLSIF